jgi:hypothetical protein
VLAAPSLHEPVGQLVTTATTVEWQGVGDYASVVLSLQKPDGEVVTETFGAGRQALLRAETLSDGLYSYELRAVPRATATEGTRVQSGTFTVSNGTIVPRNMRENAAVSRVPLHPTTLTFFASDVSATGGVCGGADCTNAESYGVATIKMKANNTRLKFEDTSTSVGFPTTDWQISANDTFSGGANKLFVEDLASATVPFLIEGGTPNNALYVDSTGRIGFGTANPARDLDISVPLSPTIRMEQSA